MKENTMKADDTNKNPYSNRMESVLESTGKFKRIRIVNSMGNDSKIYTFALLEKEEGTDLTIETIRELMNKEVPEFYLPQRIFLLENAEMEELENMERLNFLLNRRNEVESEYVEPMNKYEFVLCTIFKEILNVGKVGVNDNFFSLGGDFSMALKLVNEIRNAFHTEVPVSFILCSDLTVAGLATQLYTSQLIKYDSKKIEQTIDDMVSLEG